MVSLRDRQIGNAQNSKKEMRLIDLTWYFIISAAIKQMLNLNTTQTKTLSMEPVWKVLIYDRVGQDIISPLISIRELRELGVTLHM